MRSSWLLCPCLALALLLVAPLGQADDPPALLPYQGLLLDGSGAPHDGPATVQIGVWDAPTGGVELYREEHLNVPVVDGVFQLNIGAGTPQVGSFSPSLFTGANRWLAVTVQGEGLEPRVQFLSVAYALRAGVAERLGLACDPGELVAFGAGGALECRALCQDGDFVQCYTGPGGTLGVGQCQAGERFCAAGDFSPTCTGEVTPLGEACGGGDEDCDGSTDEQNATGCVALYADGDSDGFGTGSSSCRCAGTLGYVANSLDCNDANAAVRPSQGSYFSVPASGSFDYNCNGTAEPRWGTGSCCPFVQGFVGSAPACGVSGSFIQSCDGLCQPSTASRPQECR